MKTNLIFKYLSLFALILLGVSCQTEDWSENEIMGDPKTLHLSYKISGADELATYAKVVGTADENKVDNMYTLFFRSATHPTNPNQFVGYTLSNVNKTTTGGVVTVPLPGTEDVQDEWQLIFIANLDAVADLNGAADVGVWLSNKLTGKVLDNTLRKDLVAIANKPTGIDTPLLMSAELLKVANTNIAGIELERAVARIDVVSTSADFALESASIYNARKHSYISNTIGRLAPINIANGYLNYDARVALTTTGEITSELYAFENYVAATSMTDLTTTCLIVGGKYKADPTTYYYRINVSAPNAEQTIKRNSFYTIDITKVTGIGETDPGEAHTKGSVNVKYTINEWDASFLGTYVFDADGNGMAVSQRNVTFSDAGNQEIQLEVFRKLSTSKPSSLATDWTVENIENDNPANATDKNHFSAAKEASNPTKFVVIKALTPNATTLDREVTQYLKWGDVNLPIKIKQLNPTSQLNGLDIAPNNLWFNKDAGSKTFKIDLKGNFTGLDPLNDIKVFVTENQTPKFPPGWMTLSAPTETAPGSGIYDYSLAVTPMPGLIPGDPAVLERTGNIKVVITKGGSVLVGYLHVLQSTLDENVAQAGRQLLTEVWRKKGAGKESLGNTEVAFNKFKGFPSDQVGPMQMHFALNDKTDLKTELKLVSTMNWSIEPGTFAYKNLSFTDAENGGNVKMTGGLSSGAMETIWIQAKYDIVNNPTDIASGWSDQFKIKYENGDEVIYRVNQQGVLGVHPINTADTYYYGTELINGRVWLDRNIGATSNANYTGYPTPAKGDVNALGNNLLTHANSGCPSGFRLPLSTSPGINEYDWIKNNLQKTTNADPEYANAWYVLTSSIPARRFYLPTTSNLLNLTAGASTVYLAGDKTTAPLAYLILDAESLTYTALSTINTGLVPTPGHVMCGVWTSIQGSTDYSSHSNEFFALSIGLQQSQSFRQQGGLAGKGLARCIKN